MSGDEFKPVYKEPPPTPPAPEFQPPKLPPPEQKSASESREQKQPDRSGDKAAARQQAGGGGEHEGSRPPRASGGRTERSALLGHTGGERPRDTQSGHHDAPDHARPAKAERGAGGHQPGSGGDGPRSAFTRHGGDGDGGAQRPSPAQDTPEDHGGDADGEQAGERGRSENAGDRPERGDRPEQGHRAADGGTRSGGAADAGGGKGGGTQGQFGGGARGDALPKPGDSPSPQLTAIVATDLLANAARLGSAAEQGHGGDRRQAADRHGRPKLPGEKSESRDTMGAAKQERGGHGASIQDAQVAPDRDRGSAATQPTAPERDPAQGGQLLQDRAATEQEYRAIRERLQQPVDYQGREDDARRASELEPVLGADRDAGAADAPAPAAEASATDVAPREGGSPAQDRLETQRPGARSAASVGGLGGSPTSPGGAERAASPRADRVAARADHSRSPAPSDDRSARPALPPALLLSPNPHPRAQGSPRAEDRAHPALEREYGEVRSRLLLPVDYEGRGADDRRAVEIERILAPAGETREEGGSGQTAPTEQAAVPLRDGQQSPATKEGAGSGSDKTPVYRWGTPNAQNTSTEPAPSRQGSANEHTPRSSPDPAADYFPTDVSGAALQYLDVRTEQQEAARLRPARLMHQGDFDRLEEMLPQLDLGQLLAVERSSYPAAAAARAQEIKRQARGLVEERLPALLRALNPGQLRSLDRSISQADMQWPSPQLRTLLQAELGRREGELQGGTHFLDRQPSIEMPRGASRPLTADERHYASGAPGPLPSWYQGEELRHAGPLGSFAATFAWSQGGDLDAMIDAARIGDLAAMAGGALVQARAGAPARPDAADRRGESDDHTSQTTEEAMPPPGHDSARRPLLDGERAFLSSAGERTQGDTRALYEQTGSRFDHGTGEYVVKARDTATGHDFELRWNPDTDDASITNMMTGQTLRTTGQAMRTSRPGAASVPTATPAPDSPAARRGSAPPQIEAGNRTGPHGPAVAESSIEPGAVTHNVPHLPPANDNARPWGPGLEQRLPATGTLGPHSQLPSTTDGNAALGAEGAVIRGDFERPRASGRPIAPDQGRTTQPFHGSSSRSISSNHPPDTEPVGNDGPPVNVARPRPGAIVGRRDGAPVYDSSRLAVASRPSSIATEEAFVLSRYLFGARGSRIIVGAFGTKRPAVMTGQERHTATDIRADANREALGARLAADRPQVELVLVGDAGDAFTNAPEPERARIIELARRVREAPSLPERGDILQDLDKVAKRWSSTQLSVDVVAIRRDGRFELTESKGLGNIQDAVDQLHHAAERLSQAGQDVHAVQRYNLVVPHQRDRDNNLAALPCGWQVRGGILYAETAPDQYSPHLIFGRPVHVYFAFERGVGAVDPPNR